MIMAGICELLGNFLIGMFQLQNPFRVRRLVASILAKERIAFMTDEHMGIHNAQCPKEFGLIVVMLKGRSH